MDGWIFLWEASEIVQEVKAHVLHLVAAVTLAPSSATHMVP